MFTTEYATNRFASTDGFASNSSIGSLYSCACVCLQVDHLYSYVFMCSSLCNVDWYKVQSRAHAVQQKSIAGIDFSCGECSYLLTCV